MQTTFLANLESKLEFHIFLSKLLIVQFIYLSLLYVKLVVCYNPYKPKELQVRPFWLMFKYFIGKFLNKVLEYLSKRLYLIEFLDIIARLLKRVIENVVLFA